MNGMKTACAPLDLQSRFTVVLVRPEHPENIGLVARNMKNTGFEKLRIVDVDCLDQKSYKTAVHAKDVLNAAQIYKKLEEAIADLNLVFATTSKWRKNFTVISLKDAVEKMFRYPKATRIGLLFGCERTGLTSEELMHSNFRFVLPQATKQPSYNLASAVLLTLYAISNRAPLKHLTIMQEQPLPQKKQKECIEIILDKLEDRGFIHATNKQHVTEMIYDVFGRIAMTERDRRFLLALFSKGTKE